MRPKRRWPVRESPFGRPAGGQQHDDAAQALPTEDPLVDAELGMAVSGAGGGAPLSGGNTLVNVALGRGQETLLSSTRRWRCRRVNSARTSRSMVTTH